VTAHVDHHQKQLTKQNFSTQTGKVTQFFTSLSIGASFNAKPIEPRESLYLGRKSQHQKPANHNAKKEHFHFGLFGIAIFCPYIRILGLIFECRNQSPNLWENYGHSQ
jgi:hypothetical protein